MSNPQTSRHVSPDGLLTLVVMADENGDFTLGFEGYSWHTHAGLLAETCGTTQERAVVQFVDDVLMNRALTAIATKTGRIVDVWISDDSSKPDPHKADDEIITFRFWDAAP